MYSNTQAVSVVKRVRGLRVRAYGRDSPAVLKACGRWRAHCSASLVFVSTGNGDRTLILEEETDCLKTPWLLVYCDYACIRQGKP